jgi:hypothetical protein
MIDKLLVLGANFDGFLPSNSLVPDISDKLALLVVSLHVIISNIKRSK